MISTRELAVATAVFASVFVSEVFCQAQTADDAYHQQSLVEAVAAFYGVTISIVASDWDDIPLVPIPTGFHEERDPFPLIPFTLSNTLRTPWIPRPSNQAMQRTAARPYA